MGYFANLCTPRCSESVSIPKNPRTDRPVGYAFVDLSTPSEAERAIAELSGKEILERKVSVQLARKPESNEKAEGANAEGAGGEGARRRQSTRGRGRAGRGRGGRARGGRGSGVSFPVFIRCNFDQEPADTLLLQDEKKEGEGATTAENAAGTADAPAPANEVLKDITNEAANEKEKAGKPQARPRERRERGPPADGIPSKTKVMVANLPYDLTEDKVRALSPFVCKPLLMPTPY